MRSKALWGAHAILVLPRQFGLGSIAHAEYSKAVECTANIRPLRIILAQLLEARRPSLREANAIWQGPPLPALLGLPRPEYLK
jgi:hypothetical protein